MHRSLPLVVFLIAGCDNAVMTPESGAGGVVNAVAIDSVTRQRVGGIAFIAGGVSAVSNPDGSFGFPAVPGPDTVRLSAAGYEPFARVLQAGAPGGAGDTLRFALRRVGPFAVRCTMSRLGFRASIVDLGGRVPLEQLAGGSVFIIDSTTYGTFPASDWQIEPLDAQEWLVTIPDAPPYPVYVQWSLRDSTGTPFDGPCETGEYQVPGE